MRRSGVLLAALALTGVVPVVAPDAKAGAASKSLPKVDSGAAPGPAVLYADPPAAPQLENRSRHFKADPILVQGHEAYARGEYLYQDWIYEDTGSDSGASDPGSTDTTGDFSYPTAPARYAGNAADLVELRIAPQKREVAYRFTLNTLLAEDTTVVALGFDTDNAVGTRIDAADDSGLVLVGADEVLTVWGTGARHANAAGAVDVPVQTDLVANQLTVVVPRTRSNPSGSWAASLAVGLNDGSGGWLRPGLRASETAPGGAGPLDPVPAGVFDLAFTDEAPAGRTTPETKQPEAIRNKVAPTRAIDFDKLARRVNESTVPATGTMSRIFPSRITAGPHGEGKDYGSTPQLLGQLQPYSIYVPTKYNEAKPLGLVLDLHSLGEDHWQYNGSIGVQQLGEQRDAIVISCECRGDDGWYQDEAEYDVFEMWNDVARHYSLDPDRVAITGYSMGGYATYRLATLYPDLFGKALSIVGPPIDGIWVPPGGASDPTLTNIWLENARNVPFLNAVAVEDELVPYPGTRAQNMGAPQHGIRGFDQLGYRFRFLSYPTAEHLTIGVLRYDLPYQVEWLGEAAVDRNPAHVTFSYLPETDVPRLGLVHDHAYWVSGIQRREELSTLMQSKATVDAFTHARGTGDPEVTRAKTAGVGPMPLSYVEENATWGEPPAITPENKLTLKLTNVASVTIDLARAGLSLDGLVLDATSDGPATVVLVDGGRTESRIVSAT